MIGGTIRKREKKKGATRKILCGCKRGVYFMDLIDFSSKQNQWLQEQFKRAEDLGMELNRRHGSKNRGYNYVLVVVDGYTRYCMIESMRDKNAKTVVNAVTKIIKTFGAPDKICCDYGKEFVNSMFRTNILEKYKVKMYHGASDQKAVLAERVIRTLKEYIAEDFVSSGGNWIDFIDAAVETYNAKPMQFNKHNYSPEQLWKENLMYIEDTEPSNMTTKDTTPQFKIGDSVRILTSKRTMQKKSLSLVWSRDRYEVVDIDSSALPLMYIVKDSNGTVKERKYYHWELDASK